MHTLFIASLIVEYYLTPQPTFRAGLLALFMVLMVVKMWVISYLGEFWSTRIYRVPGQPLIKSGPYKYFPHPNYVIVIAEIIIIPMIFNLVYTAVIFSILNAIILTIRIREENKALAL